MNRRRLFRRISVGAVNNVAFDDLVDLLAGFGFELVRINGSHHILIHPDLEESLNIQPLGRQAKPYQIRQILRLVQQHNLHLENQP